MSGPLATPAEFFAQLSWIDGRPLPAVIEPYRMRIFDEALATFDPDGRPRYNLVLAGRAKKNWKTGDLILAAGYRFFAWDDPAGVDSFILANDAGQAADDLALLKKLIAANPVLAREVAVQKDQVVRLDGSGTLKVLPAGDVSGAHGKTFNFIGYDEIHGYKNHDLFEALAPDPTRRDALTWITSYANPSMSTWGDPGYLAQQKRRLPSHKYRRLHLNLPGLPEGAAFSIENIEAAVVAGVRSVPPVPGVDYSIFVDMSGGSADDAGLAVAHRDEATEKIVVDLVMDQGRRPPFNPRHAVERFAKVAKRYAAAAVTGDRYAGQTFVRDFEDAGLSYRVEEHTKSQLYEALEPRLNAGEVALPDNPKLTEQLLGLVWRGNKVDHASGEHDDLANAAAGAVALAAGDVQETLDGARFFGESRVLQEAMAEDLDLTYNEPATSIFDEAIERADRGFLQEIRDAIDFENY